MTQIDKTFGQQCKVIVRDDTIVIYVHNAMQCAHLAAPELRVALQEEEQIK